MKVLLAGVYKKEGMRTGPEESGYSLFNTLNNNCDVTFLTKYSLHPAASFLSKWFGYRVEGRVIYAGFFRMRKAIRQVNPDILHIVNFDLFVSILFPFMGGGKKSIYTVNGIVRYDNSVKKIVGFFFKFKSQLAEKMIFSKTDALVYPSTIAKELTKKYYGIDNKRGNIIPNGIAVENFRRERQSASSGKFLYVTAYAGHPTRIAGLEVFFDAVIGTEFKFKMEIFGDVGSLVIPAPLRPHIKLMKVAGPQDWSRKLSDTDTYISLGYHETFSIASAEALAAGCCVIVSKNTGIGEYITHGENGFVVDMTTPYQLREVLLSLQTDAGYRMKVQTAARELAEKITWHEISIRYISFYDSLLRDNL